MKIDEIRQLAVWLGEAGLTAIELKRGDESVLLRRTARISPSASLSASVTPARGRERLACAVKASGPGVFFATHPDETAAYVQGGDVISLGQLVGVLRVGSVFLPVRAAVAGRVRQVSVADGQTVGYGQTLIELEELAS